MPVYFCSCFPLFLLSLFLFVSFFVCVFLLSICRTANAFSVHLWTTNGWNCTTWRWLTHPHFNFRFIFLVFEFFDLEKLFRFNIFLYIFSWKLGLSPIRFFSSNNNIQSYYILFCKENALTKKCRFVLIYWKGFEWQFNFVSGSVVDTITSFALA